VSDRSCTGNRSLPVQLRSLTLPARRCPRVAVNGRLNPTGARDTARRPATPTPGGRTTCADRLPPRCPAAGHPAAWFGPARLV